MARQSITNDIAAQICWRYLHGGLGEKCNKIINAIVHKVFPNKNIAIRMVLDIAYRIGYAKSELMDDMCERIYKIKKKRIRDKLVEIIPRFERNENGT